MPPPGPLALWGYVDGRFGAKAGRRSDETIKRTQGNDDSDARANDPLDQPVSAS